jgi:hypothetical protein
MAVTEMTWEDYEAIGREHFGCSTDEQLLDWFGFWTGPFAHIKAVEAKSKWRLAPQGQSYSSWLYDPRENPGTGTYNPEFEANAIADELLARGVTPPGLAVPPEDAAVRHLRRQLFEARVSVRRLRTQLAECAKLAAGQDDTILLDLADVIEAAIGRKHAAMLPTSGKLRAVS